MSKTLLMDESVCVYGTQELSSQLNFRISLQNYHCDKKNLILEEKILSR